MSRGKTYARVIFWSVFIPAALVAGSIFYMRGLPQRIDSCLRRMQHPNAKVASEAWWELRELYFTKWQAYDLILDHARDPEPIEFLVERTTFPTEDGGERTGHAANGKVIFYKTDRVYCRIVGDAILAFAYDEPKWKTDFEGDWDQWWLANKGYYGRP